MEETVDRQYLFAPASIMYHLAENESVAICGFYAGRKSEPKRRRDDWRITNEKPQRAFDALCGACRRKVTGEPEPEINWQALMSHRFEAMPP